MIPEAYGLTIFTFLFPYLPSIMHDRPFLRLSFVLHADCVKAKLLLAIVISKQNLNAFFSEEVLIKVTLLQQ